jgi:hypothetical protein
MSDNGTCFTSSEFAEFTQRNGIKHLTTAPFKTAANGQAERSVQVIKDGLKHNTIGDLQTRLDKLLLAYRRTPHTATGMSPAELLFNRRLNTRLKQLRPKSVMATNDVTPTSRTFNVGDAVFYRNFAKGDKWLNGKVMERRSARDLIVQSSVGKVHRHPDQLRHRKANSDVKRDDDFDWLTLPSGSIGEEQQPSTHPLQQEQRRSGRTSRPVHRPHFCQQFPSLSKVQKPCVA